MFRRGFSYIAAARPRNSLTALRAGTVLAAALVLAGCSSIGLSDFARAPQKASFGGAKALQASYTVADAADPSDWEAIRAAIARIPGDTGTQVPWSNRRTRSSGSVTALALGQGGVSNSCRAFATTINDSRGVRRYRGEACRRNDGNWQLFGVTADDTQLL